MLSDFNQNELSDAISKAYRCDEASHLKTLIESTPFSDIQVRHIQQYATRLVNNVRQSRLSQGGLDAFMAQYDLSSFEGITLMCLAEALMRIPDNSTADKLIKDKISRGNWSAHLKQSDSLFVNAATWSLMLTGKILDPSKWPEGKLKSSLNQFLNNNSRFAIRRATRQAMKIIGKQFVMGESIGDAMKRAKKFERHGYRYSYDMLGEAAHTDADAIHYLKSYADAIHYIGKKSRGKGPIKSPGISIKLSALHPRYEIAKRDRVLTELYDRVKSLCIIAKKYNIGVTIDAEEADRLEISLEVIEKLSLDDALSDWNGLGLAVQAYQHRAFYVIDWLVSLAKKSNRRLKVRLVKGAYWDSEVKLSQVEGFDGYPVFTRKNHTDISYLACAKKMLANTDVIYPMFATHNAYSLAAILEMAGVYRDFEFQCLHGMGDTLYDQIVGNKHNNIPCRIYAPVGTHKHLLAYLVRRLLENGANSSFVNRIVDENMPVEALLEDPVALAKTNSLQPHPNIPEPQYIYGAQRMNSKGLDLSNQTTLNELKEQMSQFASKQIHAKPLISGHEANKDNIEDVHNPATGDVLGTVINANLADVEIAINNAKLAFDSWDKTPAFERANMLEKMADLLEENMANLLAIAIAEAGKTLANAVNEIREAVDFCRYYACQCRQLFSNPTDLPGPTGERNQLSLHGRGPFVCISPWNFPLAIFLGEVTAALAAGNPVLAKPAEQTPLIAYLAVKLLHQAGIPKDVVQFLPGTGATVGATLTNSNDIAGVVFTGSTQTAHTISSALASKGGAIVPLIAETGGQNCMIVDSTALPEQVVTDVVSSSFDSAGQRCSALRVLFLQNDIADTVIEMLTGAMKELSIGDPSLLKTDVGPVIDQRAQEGLLAHIERLKKDAKLIHQNEVPSDLTGTFVPPTAFEIDHINVLTHEVFGPVLHIIRYEEKNLDDVINQINGTGFGLTFGIHSRIQEKVDYVTARIKAGNIYINRNTIGAVVGVQPFGGEGLSGTGFKAGGPHYLLKMATERCVSEDTTASGGNASLMSLDEN